MENMKHYSEVKRETRLYVANIKHPASTIFPLICPTKEYDWLDGWECDLLYSRSGIAELDCVFRCRVLNQKLDETWVIDVFEPNEKVQFSIFMEGCVLRWCISLFEKADGTTTESTWHMTITAFNEKGHQFLTENSPVHFSSKMKIFEAMINHYLDTGKKLSILHE